MGLTSLTDIMNIIGSAHSDPHLVLGLHSADVIVGADGAAIRRERALVMRAFIPSASRVFLLDPADETFERELERVHADGFFEALLPGREEWFMYKLRIEFDGGGVWTCYDPYSFMPVLTDFDLFLFGQSTHYGLYDKLGAHFVTHQGVWGAHFAVWAPNARRVSVIGSFNGWDGRRHQMRLLKDSGVWEIFIPGLAENDAYKFEIKTFSGAILQKTDPYANFVELRPGTASLLCDLSGFAWSDAAWIERRADENAKSPLDMPMNIYEVHPGSWARKGKEERFLSYTELADELIPYVVDMGYTHIEMMGICEYPFDGSWGYQVTGYFAPTSRYGGPKEFMRFVDKCHENGIGLILDWVPAHFPKDAHGLARFDGTALYEHENPLQGEHPEWGTLIFNYARKEVKNFLLASALCWLEKFHVDGLRVDAVASMLYLNYGKNSGAWVPNLYGSNQNLDAVEFIKHLNSVVLGRMPGALMIAEESTSWAGVSRPAKTGGLGFNMKWNMGWMNDFLKYVKTDPLFRKGLHTNLTFAMMYAYSENFVLVLSHDEVVHMKGSLIGKMPGDLWQKFANLRVALGFMYGHPGKKLLFMGGEIGQFDEWSEARSVEWFLLQYKHHKALQAFVKELNHLYKTDEPLWYKDFAPGGFEWIQCNDAASSIVSFYRIGAWPDITVFVCNFTPVARENHRVGVPIECGYTEVLNSDEKRFFGSGVVNTGRLEARPVPWDDRPYSIQMRLPPLGVAVLKPALTPFE